ncbi:outer membrane putative beta-barrel porin/alpha-amylase [Aquimarina intermedia]|uniref:Outer membrane putative beta-barrel porin/alpha-amylase n=2 Tax=Aquimarina intermedia TaxID=350814 RepID=A0A5S5C9C8_9FLAO|nr:outer membrane putative beta-barrel porin/alpha-amylase [Aquimarina intermedia]
MIKSTIFEPNQLNMSPKSILPFFVLILSAFVSQAQYTEKINSNRPGTSQGAFSVGTNVLQAEGGFGFGKEKHNLLNTKTNFFNFDYSARYGLLIEQLEIRLDGRLRSDGVRQTIGSSEEKTTRTNFEYNTLGAKYLIFDPYKNPKKDSVNLNSWKAQHRFKWKTLIPAVSAYIGVNYVTKDNPFTFPEDEAISPKVVIMTQNNWTTSRIGNWVLVTNFIIDKVTTEMPLYGWIITSTHTINDKWAVFGEYQGQKSDFYSDDILRVGGAYLWDKNLQLDAHIATNFKDTPSIFNFSFGGSYRFDWHTKDEIIEQPGLEGGVKEKEEEEILDEEKKDIDSYEYEEDETDSLKQGKIPMINDFEDEDFRQALEQDLDERRTAERLERERIESEKQAKKDEKKSRKEERKRAKREAKEAKEAEKALIKAEKERQKMIEDIDSELNKMEAPQDVDQELEQIEKELEDLEKELESERPSKPIETEAKPIPEEDIDIDKAYEEMKKQEEKRRKKEEKARKEEEKRREKEEKMRLKEEQKKQKEKEKEEKKKDQKKDDNGN